MDWFAPYSLAKSTKLIRKFLIEIASMEPQIARRGLHVTREIDDFENAIAAMDEFPELFSLLKRNIAPFDPETYSQLEYLDKEVLLIDQISLINLKLQMSRRPEYTSLLTMLETMLDVRVFSSSQTKRIFGEESISIEKTIVSCDKLLSTLKIAEDVLRRREELESKIFKASRIKEDRVVELIERAEEQINQSLTLSSETRLLVNNYLAEIKAEAKSKAPKWQAVIGSLVIVAALTSGLADAPGATKTLQSLIEYIVGVSLINPEQTFLNGPNSFDTGADEIVNTIPI
ncbi:hypothetical protein [Pseudomonas fluorescens]|uniref:hypothetical protein n=1 Tax=Pseudomonas fluorescens TaxID=294 RepID=UPI0012496164|nr:hypothetical protein [Pseudomonas fluorescens]CAG8868673.1 hypothetical protein PS861_02630 [Pseudomonas fluorescens]